MYILTAWLNISRTADRLVETWRLIVPWRLPFETARCKQKYDRMVQDVVKKLWKNVIGFNCRIPCSSRYFATRCTLFLFSVRLLARSFSEEVFSHFLFHCLLDSAVSILFFPLSRVFVQRIWRNSTEIRAATFSVFVRCIQMFSQSDVTKKNRRVSRKDGIYRAGFQITENRV
jgi:hypothetical protein